MGYNETVDKVKSTTYDVDTDTKTPQIFTRGGVLTWRWPEEMDPRDTDIDDRLTGEE